MKNAFPVLLPVFLLVASLQAESDTLPPQLVDLDISPSTVDVTLAARQVTFNLQVTDDLSGINFTPGFRVNVNLRSPSKSQLLTAAPPDQTGVVLNANLPATLTIPQFAEPGAWTIEQVRLVDNAGNFNRLTGAALAAAGFPISVEVIDATPDFEAPRLVAVNMMPKSLDASLADTTVTVDISATDDASGFFSQFPSKADFEITSPSGKQSHYIPIGDWVRISGNNTSGVWRASLVMPRFSEPGVWKIKSLKLVDRVRSMRIYSATDLAAFGAAIELTVASTPSDTTPPQLVNLTYDHGVLNTSLGSQNVIVQMTITDNLAGASFESDRVPDSSFIPFFYGGLTLQSPSGAQHVYTNAVPTGGVLSAGTPLNGVWQLDAFFPQFSEEGTWTATANIKDATHNVKTYSGAQLAALGLPATIEVIRPSLVVDGEPIGTSGGTVVDSTFGTRAQLDVPPGCFSQPTSVAIDVLQSPPAVPLPVGFSSAETYFVNVELTPTPSFPLPAPGITVVLPLRNYTIPGTQINLMRINPATGTLEPAVDISGTPIVGQVDAGGLTATFHGVARFSTVVGALPTAITVEVDVKPGETPNTINTKSKGVIPVAIFSPPTLDLTQIDPASLRFSGAPVALHKNGKWQVAFADLDGDGRDDLIAHFETEQMLLAPGDALGLVEGRTLDNRIFRGVDSVSIIK